MLQCRMLICGHHKPIPCYRIYQRCIWFFIADLGQNYNKQIRLMMYLPQSRPILGNTCTGTCTQFAGTNTIFLAVYWACYKISSPQDKRFGHILNDFNHWHSENQCPQLFQRSERTEVSRDMYMTQWHTQEFCFGGVQQIQLRTEQREIRVLEAAVIWYKKFHFT